MRGCLAEWQRPDNAANGILYIARSREEAKMQTVSKWNGRISRRRRRRERDVHIHLDTYYVGTGSSGQTF
jgi:hypothetical protein